MLWPQAVWACPWTMWEGRDCSMYVGCTEAIGGVSACGGRGSLRSSGAWGCFCWRLLRDSLLGLTNELLPDKVWRAPLILKSDSFWFTSLFMFLARSLWVLVGGGVACLEEASGTGRQSDSRYVLILDLMEEVKETPCDRGPDERTERGKHTKRCQSNGEFEEMALLMSLISP